MFVCVSKDKNTFLFSSKRLSAGNFVAKPLRPGGVFRFRRFRAASAAARSRPLAEDCHSPQARCCLRSAAGRTECVRSAGFDPNENSRVSACRSPPPLAADGRPRVARCPPAAVGELPMCGSPSVRRRRRRRAGASPREGPQLAQGSRASPRKLRPIFHSLRYSPNELPPMNSRRIEVGGISSGIIGTKLSRNLSMRRASSYSGIVSGTSRSSGSA